MQNITLANAVSLISYKNGYLLLTVREENYVRNIL